MPDWLERKSILEFYQTVSTTIVRSSWFDSRTPSRRAWILVRECWPQLSLEGLNIGQILVPGLASCSPPYRRNGDDLSECLLVVTWS